MATEIKPFANDNWPLVVTRQQAADMCRISVTTFDSWVRKNIVAGPIPGTRRWSRIALERSLSGSTDEPATIAETSAFEQWKRGHAH